MYKIPNKSYFPLLIQYAGNHRVKVESPEQIESSKPFYVVETNYKRNDCRSNAEIAWEEDMRDNFLDSDMPHP